MSTLRRRSRETAFQILYGLDQELSDAQQTELGPIELSDLLVRHFDHFKVDEKTREFAARIVASTISHRTELDELIRRHAANWKIDRMSAIDRCILRMGACELLHFTDVPDTVTIDEAVELAKQFGSEDSSAFVNGILDAIRDAIRKERKDGEEASET